MAIIKCKMCGGDLSITEGATVTECEYCGTTQTVPKVDDEKKLTLFSRANRLRQANEFDKAAGVYENLVADFPTEAEAYWGLVLCRYGIEYVDDPATGKKMPTCHRSSFDSILEDSDFEQSCENADAIARRVYRDEAKAIENIRKGIIEVSGKEPPYDIFICYKETAEDGQRTIDSVLAQDVYDALTGKGYRVFFSRITLEDKLGTEYEPYIFAALNSAKVMLVFGTDYEYFNAVWVKNEWSRFLKLMAQDKSKHLIPCYKDVDAYDMPKEFQKLQAQDMGKVGAVQDLLRGIDKLLGKGQAAPAAQPAPVQVVSAGGPTVDSLLKRAQILLEDRDWKSANEYFDKVLEIDPECAEAYLGKFCAEMEYTNPEMMAQDTRPLKDSRNKANALRFASPELRAQLEKYQQSAEEKARQDAEKARQEAERKRSILAPIRPLVQGMLLGISGDTFGLRADGTVVAVGYNVYGQCNVSDWQDIVAIEEGFEIGIAHLSARGHHCADRPAGGYAGHEGSVREAPRPSCRAHEQDRRCFLHQAGGRVLCHDEHDRLYRQDHVRQGHRVRRGLLAAVPGKGPGCDRTVHRVCGSGLCPLELRDLADRDRQGPRPPGSIH